NSKSEILSIHTFLENFRKILCQLRLTSFYPPPISISLPPPPYMVVPHVVVPEFGTPTGSGGSYCRYVICGSSGTPPPTTVPIGFFANGGVPPFLTPSGIAEIFENSWGFGNFHPGGVLVLGRPQEACG